MKRITIGFLLLLFINISVKAQDFKKVRNNLTLAQAGAGAEQKLEDAKTELEKVLADPKAQNHPEAHLLKAEVYGSIAANNTLKEKYPNADLEGFQALQKYLELEPAETKLKEDNYRGINGIYSSLFASGVKEYNAKNWEAAYAKFKEVARLGDLFTSRKWSNAAFDTTSYLYAGVTAQNAKKDQEAAAYYGKLAELKLTSPEYESIYDYLTKYYLNNKDEANFRKYIALAKESFPKNSLWKDLEFAYMTENTEPEAMLKSFNDADAGKTLASANYLDYGDYFINNKKIKDLDPTKRADYTRKASYAFSRAYELDTTNALAAYNAGVAAYTLFEEASDEARKIKGVTADIKSKRAAADKVVDAAADNSIRWMERAFNSLAAKTTRTNTEKNVVGKAADLLYNLYAYKKDRSRGVNPKDFDRYEAKSKYYDSMHGKF